ncbi:TadE/TadG family type IV pilus assembly protein [Nocardioides sp. GCM10027113]|uniref:TadE/TadG family type IV pilus assembly protein n=1 Tax=unclassified Nocardioides TaxID=2615069 RepID=UPI0036235170
MKWPQRPRRVQTDHGAAAVEFALVVPILLLLVFGIIQYGMYFWAYQGGSDIARDAVRLSAVGDPATCTDFRNEVRGQITGLTGSGGTATITRDYDSSGDVLVGDKVTVTVSFTSFDLQLPFLPFVNNGRVTSTAEAMVEYVPAPLEDCS